MKRARNILRTAFLFSIATVASIQSARADDDVPCPAPLRDQLKIVKTAPDFCETTTRLVPGRAVVLALWDTSPDSPPEIPLEAVLDLKALQSGHKDYLYKRKALGESFNPFLFKGKSVTAAIADFDGNNRIGWAAWLIPDADYFFDITVYDSAKKKFVEIGPGNNGTGEPTSFTATDIDAMVEASKGQILVPMCDASGGTPTHPRAELYFDVYTIKNGTFEQGKRIPAKTASASEHAKCAQMAQ